MSAWRSCEQPGHLAAERPFERVLSRRDAGRRGSDRTRFPKASTHIPDIEASEWASFKRTLDRASCLLLHLSEGLDDKARDAFLALQNSQGEWAISPALAGIHCAGLHPEDFAVLAQHGGSMCGRR